MRRESWVVKAPLNNIFCFKSQSLMGKGWGDWVYSSLSSPSSSAQSRTLYRWRCYNGQSVYRHPRVGMTSIGNMRFRTLVQWLNHVCECLWSDWSAVASSWVVDLLIDTVQLCENLSEQLKRFKTIINFDGFEHLGLTTSLFIWTVKWSSINCQCSKIASSTAYF